MENLQVMVIGAGTGGLALAHGLRASGIGVRVFERDHNLTERAQGYRLTINTRGARALHSCLPKANFDHHVTASPKSARRSPFLITSFADCSLSKFQTRNRQIHT